MTRKDVVDPYHEDGSTCSCSLINLVMAGIRVILEDQLFAMRNTTKCVFQSELILRSFLGHISCPALPYPNLPYKTLHIPAMPFYLPTYLSTYLPTYQPTYLPTYLTTYLSTYLPTY